MNIEAGPAFGAILIGGGIGVLLWQKYQDPVLAIGVGVAVTIADYVFLMATKKYFKK